MMAATGEAAAEEAVAGAFHHEWGRIVAALIRTTGDWDLAEECAQDAFAQALARWPLDGVPERPGAWLTTVARNKAYDRLRRSAKEAGKLKEAEKLRPSAGNEVNDDQAGYGGQAGFGDDRLRLIFTCCHPALALEARVALTLRTLAGLTTAEIAKAFLVPEATMAKRLARAKHKITNAGIPYRVPPPQVLPERLGGVLAVLYLLFNEGYASSGGEGALTREGLCQEGIRLARLLGRLMPDEAEVGGLLALMLFQHSRRAARVDAQGDLVRLEDQDRSLWDADEVDEAKVVLSAALRRGRAGPYQLQAAIAACHATAPVAEATDWARIAALYGRLAEMVPSPVVELNRAVAVSMAEGAGAGLVLVDELVSTGSLGSYYLLAATRADFLRRLGRQREAAAAYRAAMAGAPSEAEKRYLARRTAEAEGLDRDEL